MSNYLNSSTGAARRDPSYANQDPLGYMDAHGLAPAPNTDYSPNQARGLVNEAKKALARLHHSGGMTMVSYSDDNLPPHKRKVQATVWNHKPANKYTK